jgi:2-polyprenyl-3-methyl-5-hydroxy-6-metoxy-1,4-benzoquinol methylase
MIPTRSAKAFDFGENWSEYSTHALTPERVVAARTALAQLLANIPLRGVTFLDIGFGQGLGLLTAASMGGIVQGCDLNPKCAEVLGRNRRHFPEITETPSFTV